jgi:hypothetical protein
LIKKLQKGLHNGGEKPSALKREHPALQKMKLIICFIFFWAIFVKLDPDPDCESGPGYGSTDPIESGSTLHTRHKIYQKSQRKCNKDIKLNEAISEFT